MNRSVQSAEDILFWISLCYLCVFVSLWFVFKINHKGTKARRTHKEYHRCISIAVYVVVFWITSVPTASGQDTVRYRGRGPRGERPIQQVNGKIESESLAGIKVAGNIIAASDIVDVEYETPGGIRIDMREARQADESHKIDDAIRRYRALAASPAATSNPALKRSFEFKVATLMSAKADISPVELKAATAALTKWTQDHPDSWQRLPASRLLARLHLDADPPNYDAARRVFDELAALPAIAPQLKNDCQLASVDLYLSQRNNNKAKQLLDALATSDPRVPIYRIACLAEPGNADTVAKQLEDLLPKADESVKATIYNLLGDTRRLQPAKQKEARFAYLWVELIYNQDSVETAKAQDNLAELFKNMGQEERAKTYRDKARGR